jgi:single-strand DNA-binding protein
MINKVILVGNLGANPELKSTNSGMSVSSMRLATSDRKKDGATGDWVDVTEWHTVTVFGATADNCCKFLEKGRQIYVEGRLQTRKWQDKEGKDRWSTEIVANKVKFLGSKNGASVGSHDENIPF